MTVDVVELSLPTPPPKGSVQYMNSQTQHKDPHKALGEILYSLWHLDGPAAAVDGIFVK